MQTEDDSDWSAVAAEVPAEPHLVLVMFADDPSSYGARFALSGLDQVLFARAETLTHTRSTRDGLSELHLGLPARALSALHARLRSEDGAFVLEDLGSRNGTFVNGARVEQAVVADGDVVEMGRTFFLFRTTLPAGKTPDLLPAELRAEVPGFRTLLPSLAARFSLLQRVAQSDVPVLLEGPTGAGKEVLARAVHDTSGRKGEFVAVNCGALPDSLVEAQLFGHSRGAFSGALRDEPGFVRAADGGTLLLDEIGDLPLAAQAVLLRVLQEREVVPVGATRPISVDVRFLSATHRPLDALVAQGKFRADLLARLRGFRHAVTPLRERREDLGLIIADILRRTGDASPIAFTPTVVRAFLQYVWPLSIRELQQCLRAASAMTSGGTITPRELPGDLAMLASGGFSATPSEAPPSSSVTPVPSDEKLEEFLRLHLAQSGGNVAAVARLLGKAPFQVRRWLKRFALDPNAFRERS